MTDSEVPGFVLTAPNGWYFSTCSMTAITIIILGSSLIFGVILIAVVVVIVCICWRRRKAQQQQNSNSSYQPVVNKEDNFWAQEAAKSIQDEPNKTKKKKYAKPVQYTTKEQLSTDARYYQSRNKK